MTPQTDQLRLSHHSACQRFLQEDAAYEASIKEEEARLMRAEEDARQDYQRQVERLNEENSRMVERLRQEITQQKDQANLKKQRAREQADARRGDAEKDLQSVRETQTILTALLEPLVRRRLLEYPAAGEEPLKLQEKPEQVLAGAVTVSLNHLDIVQCALADLEKADRSQKWRLLIACVLIACTGWTVFTLIPTKAKAARQIFNGYIKELHELYGRNSIEQFSTVYGRMLQEAQAKKVTPEVFETALKGLRLYEYRYYGKIYRYLSGQELGQIVQGEVKECSQQGIATSCKVVTTGKQEKKITVTAFATPIFAQDKRSVLSGEAGVLLVGTTSEFHLAGGSEARAVRIVKDNIDRSKVVPWPYKVGNKTTFLIWQRQDDGRERNWQKVNNYCEDLSLAGYHDWRLPTISELEGLVDKSKGKPMIDTAAFAGGKRPLYWSSTTPSYPPGHALFVNLANGGVYHFNKEHALYVRCVRGGQ